VYITQKHKTDLLYTAEIYFALGGLFRFDELRTEAKKLHGDTEWTRGAISGVLDSLYAAQAALTIKVIQQQSKLKTPKIGAGQTATVSWSKANEKVITHLVQSIGHVLAEQSVDLAMLTVTEQRLRRLL
jgi:NAD-specific glutamate dehydrogenase